MQGNITRLVGSLTDGIGKPALRRMLRSIGARMSSQATATAGLVIKTGGSALAKTGSTAFAGTVNGVPVAIAASTDMPALTGINITAAYYRIVCFFIDAGSTVTAVAGAEGATLATAKFPDFPLDKTLVGYLVITYASAFTGGTTALDTATTVYVSPVGAFDPTITI
jgi:hypothetical protein